MNEIEVKKLYKLAVEYGKHNLTDVEKEAIKTAIDSSKTIDDLFTVALMIVMADNNNC